LEGAARLAWPAIAAALKLKWSLHFGPDFGALNFGHKPSKFSGATQNMSGSILKGARSDVQTDRLPSELCDPANKTGQAQLPLRPGCRCLCLCRPKQGRS